MKAFVIFKIVATGVAMGVAISIVPFPLNVLCAALVLGFWLVRPSRLPSTKGASHWMVAGIAAATVLGAILLPVKQLDGSVGPFRYEPMSMEDLCRRLGRDHRVFVSADQQTGTNRVPAFFTDHAMSRRAVLQKLARETDCELRIGYCGTGATLLFGAHPSFTRLRAKRAHP